MQGKVVPGFASDFLHQMELSCQCVKLDGERHTFAFQLELAFANHLHQFNAGRDRMRRSKRLDTEQWPGATFDRAVILFDNVVEVFDVSFFNWEAALDGRTVSSQSEYFFR